MAASDVTAAVSAAVTAMGTSDWDTALGKLLQAKAYLIAIPDRTDSDGAQLQYDRAAIDSLIRENPVVGRERLYEIPGIVDPDGRTYFWLPPGTESRESWVLGLSTKYSVLSEVAWLARFYS